MGKKRKTSTDDGDAGSEGSSQPPSQRGKVPPHRLILAPMVGGSELAFRILVRRYAPPAMLAYTPMMSSSRFASEPEYRDEIFSTLPGDRPLVAHFAANDPQVLLAAARIIEPKVDAVDLNLGCPQRIAHSGHFGSFLLDDVDRPLVLSMIRTLAQSLTVPVFAKIRLLTTTAQTIELVTQLRDAGAALVAVHARHRVSLVGRSGPTARDGPAFLDEVAKVRAAVDNVRIVSNGNVRNWDDVCSAFEQTGADGVMSAEGLLDDPALFFPAIGCVEGAPGPSAAVAPSAAEAMGTPHATTGAVTGAATDVLTAAPADGASAVTEEEKLVRKLTKKLRAIERLEAMAAARDGGLGSLSNEEAAKVAQRAEAEAELAKAQKALRKANKKRKHEGLEPASEPPAPAAARADAAPATASAWPTAVSAATPPSKKPPPLQLATEYLELAEAHGVPIKTVVFHIRRMAKEPLTRFQLLSDILEAADNAAVRGILARAVEFDTHGFTPDPEKARREREALELKKWREATRRRFEERMQRKAARAGLPVDHFLKQGAEVPTVKAIAELKAMAAAAAWERWKSRHGQHCWAMHMEAGGCTRERTCAFLHADAQRGAEADEPSWLQENHGH